MSILPLVISFILVLSITSFSFLKERTATLAQTKSLFGHMRGVRLARNAFEEDLFRGWSHATEHAVKEPLAQKKKRTQEGIKAYQKIYAERRRCSLSTLNLAPLVETKEKKVRRVAIDLLETLYGHTWFYKEAKEKNGQFPSDLLEYLLEHWKKDTSSLLEEISPYLEVLYKMIKGTNAYSIKNKQGYPPLDDFFSYHPRSKHLAHVHFASLPLLTALFEKDIQEKVVAKERELWMDHAPPYLAKEELNALILDAHKPSNPLDFLTPYLNFSTKPPKKTTLHLTDGPSKIRIKQQVHEWELTEE